MKKIMIAFTMAGITILTLSSCKNSGSSSKYTHAFSVSETEQVYFASGNLEYNPASETWRFSPVCYITEGASNENISSTYDGWIDLFGWGATGISGVAPYETVEDNFSYAPGHNSIAGTKYDFSNVVNETLGGNYRMFTHTEIHYMLMYRENAEKLFGYGTIDGNRGLFILPDDWVCPEGICFSSSVDKGFENQYNWYYTIGDKENYNYNNFTVEDWDKIEEAGGVFLPVTGMRCGTSCDHVGLSGHYWTSSNYGEEFANCLCLFEHDLFLEGNFDRLYGLGVRLVKNAE